MSAAVSFVRTEEEGERLRFWGGGILTMKQEDELLYVLEGEILVAIDGEEHLVGAGGVAFAPRGVPHAFLVTSPTARLLTLLTPGSAEAFYRGAGEPAAADADPSGPVDFARVQEAAERSGGMRVLGPPPFAP
jgi:hypothetical protein